MSERGDYRIQRKSIRPLLNQNRQSTE